MKDSCYVIANYFLSILFSFSMLIISAFSHGSTQTACLITNTNTTILQIWKKDLQRSENEWNALFSKLKANSFDKILLQWTVFKDKHKSEYLYQEHNLSELLDKLYLAAKANSIHISIGLIYDNLFWEKISGTDSELENYFSTRLNQLEHHVSFLTDLIETIDSKNAVFSGWYVSDEIDNLNWLDNTRSAILFRYLKSVGDMLRIRHPDWPISITGYTVPVEPDPQLHALFWKDLLNHSGFDKVLYQDSIGTGKISMEYWQTLHEELHKTLGTDKYSVIVELFDIEKNLNDETNFTAADFNRVNQQISIANTFSHSDLVFFSAFDYLLDESAIKSERLLEQWKKSIKNCQ